MRIKVKKNFVDREANMKERNAGEEFEARETRAKYLVSLGFVELIPTKTKESKN